MPTRPPAPLASHEALDLGALLGPEWEGFRLSRAGLHHPYWRRPFDAGDFKAMFYRSQQVAILESDLARTRRDLERAQAAQDAAEECAAWYRRQLILESRTGAMLARLAA